MPGYNVVGIDCDSGNDNIISLSGAIHCITHSVGVADPLMISHLPLQDTDDTENAYAVTADLSHRSGLASVTLSWATSPEGPWTDVAMTEVDAIVVWWNCGATFQRKRKAPRCTTTSPPKPTAARQVPAPCPPQKGGGRSRWWAQPTAWTTWTRPHRGKRCTPTLPAP